MYRIHPLFVLLMLLSVAVGCFVELVTLFGVVLIHELGHVAAAKGFGWRIKEVQLLPFGGVAVTEEGAGVPAREEFIVALAGPLQNAVMIVFALLCQAAEMGNAEWWNYFIKANLLIGSFNLLPIPPLDGGRVLTCLLSYLVSYRRVLAVSAWTGIGFSAVLTVCSVFPLQTAGVYLNLAAVGLYLLASNWYALKHVPFQFLRFLTGREARAADLLNGGTLAQPVLIPGDVTLSETAGMFMREKYHLIYIFGGQGTVHRVIPEQQFVRIFFDGGKTNRAVSEVFR